MNKQEKLTFACKPHFEWTPFRFSLRQHLTQSASITQMLVQYVIWKQQQQQQQQ